jgi:DNA-binding HxlR family transcriptional regulator
MRVLAQQQRAVDGLAGAVFADRLRDRENMGFIERAGERRAAVAARPE